MAMTNLQYRKATRIGKRHRRAAQKKTAIGDGGLDAETRRQAAMLFAWRRWRTAAASPSSKVTLSFQSMQPSVTDWP